MCWNLLGRHSCEHWDRTQCFRYSLCLHLQAWHRHQPSRWRLEPLKPWSHISVHTDHLPRRLQCFHNFVITLIIYLNCKCSFIPGCSSATRQHTNTHITRNKTTVKENTAFKTPKILRDILHTINTMQKIKNYNSLCNRPWRHIAMKFSSPVKTSWKI
jgi:hypothetical protein